MPGWWLDPRTDESYLVSTHEQWLINPKNLDISGVREPYRHEILALAHDATARQDEIRTLGCMAGLVRIRTYRSHVSAQMYFDKTKVRGALHSIYEFLKNNLSDPHASIQLENMVYRDSTTISLAELGERLELDQPVLREQAPIRDIRLSQAVVDRIERKLRGL